MICDLVSIFYLGCAHGLCPMSTS